METIRFSGKQVTSVIVQLEFENQNLMQH